MKTVKAIKSKLNQPTAKAPIVKVPVVKAAAVSPARKPDAKTTTPAKAAPAKTPAAPAAGTRREVTSEIIAARAYIIWEQRGRPQGSELENWLLAENQLKQEQSFTA